MANFLRQYRDQKSTNWKEFTAQQFSEVWSHYDDDGNGYIEGSELDGFLKEFISSASKEDVGTEIISDAMFSELKRAVMEAYDENDDNRIEIGELAQMLPMEESFLLLFRRDNPLASSVEFMKVWREFDQDQSGYIESDELKEFLSGLLKSEEQPVNEEKLQEYTDTMLELFDQNKDGKLQLSEMTKLLPVEQNFLCRPVFKSGHKLTKFDIDRTFQQYDSDHSGTIEGDELMGFLKDLMDMVREDYDESDLQKYKDAVMQVCDQNQDGKLDVGELTMILLQQGGHELEDSDEDF